MITIPTILTLIRLFLVVPLAGAILDQSWVIALLIFAIAVVTDLLDGYLARLFKQESFLGACLDPIADKLLIVTSYGALLCQSRSSFLPEWFFYLVLGKEALLVAGAMIFGLLQNRVTICATWAGKYAMVAQSVLIASIFIKEMVGIWHPIIGEILIWISTALVIVALGSYSSQLLFALVRKKEYGR
ncbi:MAG: CDP-alcohol phosphatidyltransferase family protein [Candidatus Babeliaceae bacterium]|nr:CDP-alcohol phosphatidyltransferase family protein [Candidatus Babeliaceae bacterium]